MAMIAVLQVGDCVLWAPHSHPVLNSLSIRIEEIEDNERLIYFSCFPSYHSPGESHYALAHVEALGVMLGGDGRDRGKLLRKDVLTFIKQLLWQSYKLITFCLMDLETRN